MDWPLAIERNRAALLVVAAAIAALVAGPDAAGMLARRLRNAALALLRPAEAAARRLIVIAARGLTVTLRAARPFPAGLRVASAAAGRPPAFALFDRPKRFPPMLRLVRPPRGEPRIRSFWSPAVPAVLVRSPEPVEGPKDARPDPDAPVDVARLRRRLQALQAALADLPRQAARLARARARRAASPQRAPRSPLRIGRPPGWRRPRHEVDVVLRECHALALDARGQDTS